MNRVYTYIKGLAFALLMQLPGLLVHGQNLVPNPSFELHNDCSAWAYIGGMAYKVALYPQAPTVQSWYTPTLGSADYFGACTPAAQIAHSGMSFMGIIAANSDSIPNATTPYSNAEYISAPLTKSMVVGHTYEVSFYANLLNTGGTIDALDKLGAVFTDGALSYQFFSAIQDTADVMSAAGDYIIDTGWRKITGYYKALGNEQWITIGYFNDGSRFTYKQLKKNTGSYSTDASYYYIDDVSVFDTTDITNRRDTALCEFSATLTLYGKLNGKSYLWSTGAIAPSISVPANSSATYWVKTKTDTANYIDTIYLTVYPKPVLSLSTDQLICKGTSVPLAASGADKYQWSPAAGLSCTACASPQASPNQQTVYTVVGINGGLCADTGNVTVNVDSAYASFTIGTDTLCGFDSLIITNTSTGDNLSYRWDMGDGDTSLIANPVHTYLQPGIKKLALFVKNTTCSSRADTIVVVSPDITAPFSIRDTILCAGKLLHVSTELLGGYNYMVWDFGDGERVHNMDDLTHLYNNGGEYTVALQVKYPGCDPHSYSDTINVIANPIVNIGPDTVICPYGQPIEISDQVNMVNSNAKWQWNTGATTPGIAVQEPGIYNVTVSINGCSTTDSIEIRKGCYIAIPNSFSPNGDGVNDYFFPRQLLSSNVSSFSMSIFNRWGQLIYETNSTDGRGWDGSYSNVKQQEGVYVYAIDVAYNNNVREHYTGNITLLR